MFHNTVFREKESMTRTVNYISIFLLLVAAAACKPNRIAATNRFENSRIILDKQECYGTCPVFTIEVNGTGKVIYEGKRFVKRSGKYEKQLKPEEVNKLFNAFDCANFFDFKSAYDEPLIHDLPTVFLTFEHRGIKKTVIDRYNAPEELKDLEKLLEKIADSPEGWRKIE